jgi:hypothetical protein
MSMEHLVEWVLARESKVIVDDLPHCHFVRNKFHMTWLEIKPVRRVGRPETNHLSYGTAMIIIANIATELIIHVMSDNFNLTII